MKLAILDADILADPLRAVYDDYGRLFRELMMRAGGALQTTAYSVINGVYPASFDDYDAFLVTGSKYDSFSEEEWVVRLRDYVRLLYQSRNPLIGICFGHQLLAHALGGRSGRSTAGWGLGVHTYELDHRASFVDKVGPIRLIASHQDQVHVLPPEARPLLSSDFCPLAGFYIPNRVLTIQGHPEFTEEYANALITYRADRFPAERVAAVRASHATPHDGLRVADWIESFVADALASKSVDDQRRSAPAALRNRQPIADVLHQYLPAGAHVLEVASGTGEHAMFLSDTLQVANWWPTDADPAALTSIEAWRQHNANPALHPPLRLDVCDADPQRFAASHGFPPLDALVCINMIHISPWAACQALMKWAGQLLREDGILYLYGPFRRDGNHTAASNAEFDASLKQRNPAWGVRELEAVTLLAAEHGLRQQAVVAMPANNFSVIFRKSSSA